MLSPGLQTYLAPFPQVPDGIKAKFKIGDLLLRPYGIFKEDLEVNFSLELRPYLVTQILECCTVSRDGVIPDESFFWELPLGKRIESIVSVATLGRSAGISVTLLCPTEPCQERMEIEISLEELSVIQNRVDKTDPIPIRVGDKNVTIRKPIGRDQLAWLKNSFVDENNAVREMIWTLVLDDVSALFNKEDPLPDEWVQVINRKMADGDPLVNFSLSVKCPYCERENLQEIDLEELSLRELRKAKVHLLENVHRLAAYYHWSERQIFSIPPWRRSHYLTLIDRDKSS